MQTITLANQDTEPKMQPALSAGKRLKARHYCHKFFCFCMWLAENWAGATFFSQSPSLVIQNLSNREITWDCQLKTALSCQLMPSSTTFSLETRLSILLFVRNDSMHVNFDSVNLFLFLFLFVLFFSSSFTDTPLKSRYEDLAVASDSVREVSRGNSIATWQILRLLWFFNLLPYILYKQHAVMFYKI